MSAAEIVWTETDEAPALASRSLLPIVEAFVGAADVSVRTADISLAGRILAQFPERLDAAQRVPDELAELGELVEQPDAVIIKLPNISAPVGQLKAAIRELQEQGFEVPDYPEDPQSDEERDIAQRYAKVLGSAVNPVLRQGNSDRRAPLAVKRNAQANPHRLGEWTSDNRARVACMSTGDFFGNEQSFETDVATRLAIVFTPNDGEPTTLAEVTTTDGEIVDATMMSIEALRDFYRSQMAAAADEGLLLSLHLKATMMKVSDPVMFGHAVATYFESAFDKHADTLAQLGVNPNLGLSDVLDRVATLPQPKRDEVLAAFDACLQEGPALAMVDSDRGITNLHNPNDVIIDASMPVIVRDSGCMWNSAGQRQQTLALVPDRSYGTMYAAVFDDMRANGALDPATMGSVPNVGLMAQKAEEYGSHPTTFIAPGDGRIEVLDKGEIITSHDVRQGDIWRMSRVRDLPIRDWVRLAVERARVTGAAAVFFLDENRPHDAQVLARVRQYLADMKTSDLDIRVAAPADAVRICLERARQGLDTISVTGNVLRDYLTDLFPILELGTSAKMLSIVPLLAGGGLFETGAGGSAPKHVQQFTTENYLRWDSLGEFSALGACLDHIARTRSNPRAKVLADALDAAIGRVLDENRSPARKLGAIDNRGSHFYLAWYWADALAHQEADADLAERFAPLAEQLNDQSEQILSELNAVQGTSVDLGGYYHPDATKASAAMRPSDTLNRLVDELRASNSGISAR